MDGKDKILYIEANSGISGDMFVAALLDLGAPEDMLRAVLDSIPVTGCEVVISRKERAGIDVCDFDVKPDHEHENYDHDMDYLYGHEAMDSHGHTGKSHEYTHTHEHTDDHALGHTHDHAHRGLKEIREILQQTQMTDTARALALRIFEILAKAEAKAHGVPAEEVHFHEVGAVDSIVDIISAAVCVDALAPDRVVVSPLTEGHGTVRTQHGILPVPVPAVTHIVAEEGLVLRQGVIKGELVTPTGAAIAAAIRTDRELPATYRIDGIGIGGGKREYEPPSMVRAMWICEENTCAKTCEETIWKLETDIDDCTGEALGFVMERLYEAGAREVHFTPVFMKKNRPAYELGVITTDEKREELEGIIFKETTTIGIRRQRMERTVLPREEASIETAYGTVAAKRVTLPDGEVRTYPEYESAKELALEAGVPLQEIQ